MLLASGDSCCLRQKIKCAQAICRLVYGTVSGFLHWKASFEGISPHFVHCIMICLLEEDIKCYFNMFSPPKEHLRGHFIMLSSTTGHPSSVICHRIIHMLTQRTPDIEIWQCQKDCTPRIYIMNKILFIFLKKASTSASVTVTKRRPRPFHSLISVQRRVNYTG